ncbi:hypothetical protein [Candidatus Vidania fulgoroideorum]
MSSLIFFFGLPYSGKTLYSYIYSYILGNNFLDFDFFFEKIYNTNLERLLLFKSNEYYLRSFEYYIIILLISNSIYFSPGGGFPINYSNLYILLHTYINTIFINRPYITPNFRSIYITNNIYKLLNERSSFYKTLYSTSIVND